MEPEYVYERKRFPMNCTKIESKEMSPVEGFCGIHSEFFRL